MAVETAVDDRLDTMPQGLEERSNSQCGDDNHDRRRSHLSGDRFEEACSPMTRPNRAREESRQRAIDQRTVDKMSMSHKR